MNKILKIIGISILALTLFRGMIYRTVIKYNETGTRTGIEITNKNLIERIEDRSNNQKLDEKLILEIANDLTIEELKFTTKAASHNPNELINTKRANCIGYSAMFNSIANYLIIKNRLQNEIKAVHKVGQLYVLGINIHPYFESSFFQDHDFNEITNKNTGEVILIDPSVNDYLWINEVAKK